MNCDACDGTGHVEKRRSLTWVDVRPCRACGGTGMVDLRTATDVATQSWRQGDLLEVRFSDGEFRVAFYRSGEINVAGPRADFGVSDSWSGVVDVVNKWLTDGPLAPPKPVATVDDEVPI